MLRYFQVKRLFAFAVFFGYFIFGLTAFTLFFFRRISELELAIICSPYGVIAAAAISLFQDVVINNKESSVYRFFQDDLDDFIADLKAELDRSLSSRAKDVHYFILRSRYNEVLDRVKEHLQNNVCADSKYLEEILSHELMACLHLHRGAVLSDNDMYYYLRRVLFWLDKRQTYRAMSPVPYWRSIPLVFSGFAYPVSGALLLWIAGLHIVDVPPAELASATGLFSAILISYWNTILNEFLGID
jgi:hypothetical protein